MKKTILILFTVAIASVNALAQAPAKEKREQKTPEERAENMTKRLTKELDLNVDQQVKAKAIILKREQEREKIEKSAREGHEKVKAEFKAFLTSEQFQKFEQKEAEMKKKREERRKQQRVSGKEALPPPAPEAK
jgi:protein CpxP